MANETKSETNKKPGRPPAVKPKPVEPAVETPPVKETPPVEPAVKEKSAAVDNACPNHPKVKATTYGLCVRCYDKLSKAEKRGLFLKARLTGGNAHSYPLELRRVWRREVALIEAGLWKRPLKTKAKTSLDEALSG